MSSITRLRRGLASVCLLGLVLAAALPALADVALPPPPPPPPAAVAAPPALSSPDIISACPKDAAVPVGPVEDGSLSGKLKDAVASGNWLIALLFVFVGGFLTALSPCVYPLIPITLSIFGARQAASHFQGFLLAATYVSGMVILYAGLGVGFAAAGYLAGSALQSPLVTMGVALLCIIMAASMFGAFEMVLPTGIQTRLAQAGGAGFKGAFVMGLVAGVIAAPCTGPVLSFVLTLIARDGDVAKGGVMMVVYALGMGLPFLVLGTFSQAISRLPKSGRWMEVVKSVFGLMMLGAAVYFLRLGVPAVAAAIAPLGKSGLVGPALLVIGAGLGALHLSFKMSETPEKVRKALGVFLASAGIISMLAWLNKTEDKVTGTEPAIAWVTVKNTPDAIAAFDTALAQAKQKCMPVMIDFFAEWCIACKELDKYTYVDDDVKKAVRRFVSIKIDATEESTALAEIQSRYGVVGLPTIAFVDSQGRVMPDPRVTGFVGPKDYVPIVNRVR